VLFYLLVYGATNMGAFAVLASMERPVPASAGPPMVMGVPVGANVPVEPDTPTEIEHVEDLRGLCYSSPLRGWTMVICAASLLGLPPLLGFFGKVPLFTTGIAAGEIPLVIVLGINSAIAAFYYLRLVALPLLEEPGPRRGLAPSPFATRSIAGVLSAGAVIVLAILGNLLMGASNRAAKIRPVHTISAPQVERIEQEAGDRDLTPALHRHERN
jgi:NADH-quinone oxidoreductase subunit N